MARKLRQEKQLIYVFCEGESEQAYADFLKKNFEDVAIINRPKSTGLFEYANKMFQNNIKYKNQAEIIDEIWFFYDVEKEDIDKWISRQKIINKLKKLRRKPNIKVRLLMTTACIEYWFMLHYKQFAPCIETKADKDAMLREVKTKEPTYQKGDKDSIERIAARYKDAVKNASTVFNNLVSDGLPTLEDCDERNKWLTENSKTFSTVFEAVEFLESLDNE